VALADDSRDFAIADSARVGDYFELLKPRVMSLVVFTAFVGLLLAPGGIDPIVGAIAILCIAVGAGASGALNMWYDAEIDAVMSRTANRPIPSGRVPRHHALTLGIWLSIFSVGLLALATNWIAAGLLAFTIFFYAVIYTMWLKRATPQNIVIGGAAGAFPPMIGWAAVTGTVSLESCILFLIIFLWTPPHFWALALYKQSDYGAAGIPMLPNVAGERATKVQILLYSFVLVASTFAWGGFGFAGPIYTTVAIVTGVSFIWLAWRLFLTRDDKSMRRSGRTLFTYSLSYLFVIFFALITDHVAQMIGFGL
jgi:protoheme IX farnesyltransferase